MQKFLYSSVILQRIKHKAGQKHQNADTRSHCTHLKNDEAEPKLVVEVIGVMEHVTESTAEFLQDTQSKDPGIPVSTLGSGINKNSPK